MDDLSRGMSAVAQRLSEALAENANLRAACVDLFSVRDQFAKAALPQFLELEVTGVWNQSMPDAGSKRDHARQVARAAYWMADAMMAERAASPVLAPAVPATPGGGLSTDGVKEDQRG